MRNVPARIGGTEVHLTPAASSPDGVAEAAIPPLHVTVRQHTELPALVIVSRWNPTSTERAAIALGEDVYVAQLYFPDEGGAFNVAPLEVQTGPEGYEAPDAPQLIALPSLLVNPRSKG